MWKKITVIAIVLVCLLAACSQGAATGGTAPTPAAATPVDTRPAPTKTPLSPTATETSPPPTEIPPTETDIPPTELPLSPTPNLPTVTPTVQSTVALQEVITFQQEDIIGTWESQRGLQIIFTRSGGIRIKDNTTGEEMVGAGVFRFEDEKLVLDSDVCLRFEGGFAIEFACVGTYTVYLAKAEEKVISLRFDIIEDPYRDRRNAMTGRDWQRFEE